MPIIGQKKTLLRLRQFEPAEPEPEVADIAGKQAVKEIVSLGQWLDGDLVQCHYILVLAIALSFFYWILNCDTYSELRRPVSMVSRPWMFSGCSGWCCPPSLRASSLARTWKMQEEKTCEKLCNFFQGNWIPWDNACTHCWCKNKSI